MIAYYLLSEEFPFLLKYEMTLVSLKIGLEIRPDHEEDVSD
jgi:hypothetical protein